MVSGIICKLCANHLFQSANRHEFVGDNMRLLTVAKNKHLFRLLDRQWKILHPRVDSHCCKIINNSGSQWPVSDILPAAASTAAQFEVRY